MTEIRVKASNIDEKRKGDFKQTKGQFNTIFNFQLANSKTGKLLEMIASIGLIL